MWGYFVLACAGVCRARGMREAVAGGGLGPERADEGRRTGASKEKFIMSLSFLLASLFHFFFFSLFVFLLLSCFSSFSFCPSFLSLFTLDVLTLVTFLFFFPHSLFSPKIFE
jgi:hypothetical protein